MTHIYMEKLMWGDFSTGQEMPKIASKPSKARGVAWNRFTPTLHVRNQYYQLLDLELQPLEL